MRNVRPREDIKIVVRPRGGLNIAKLQATVATAEVAGLSREDGKAETLYPNVYQNILVVSNPDEGQARAYARLPSIRVGDQVHKVGAYQTTPDRMVFQWRTRRQKSTGTSSTRATRWRAERNVLAIRQRRALRG
ncbi:hypothetical protein HPB51_023504 [Rhipicephalus microplus]|uniref:Uncharacterized protein n=1 Tax=Rhipicephalus microplus TaxID=6941 RepID=A0A9J6EIY1_RHIMP|nr:hypothetical protein HPB51_023504 [Rhipicephalus microplus]